MARKEVLGWRGRIWQHVVMSLIEEEMWKVLSWVGCRIPEMEVMLPWYRP